MSYIHEEEEPECELDTKVSKVSALVYVRVHYIKPIQRDILRTCACSGASAFNPTPTPLP
jgi:hypothetical protein